MPQDAVEPRRSHDPGNLELLTEQRDRQITTRGAGKNPRHELVAAKRNTILRKRRLVLGATVEIVEYDSRQTAAGHLPQIGDVYRIGDAHTIGFPMVLTAAAAPRPPFLSSRTRVRPQKRPQADKLLHQQEQPQSRNHYRGRGRQKRATEF